MTIAEPDLFEAARRAMVASQLRPSGINDVRILEAMDTIARETFVAEPYRAFAYIDRSVPLGGDRHINPPIVTALLLQAADIGPEDRVLVVGAASGYACAIAAMLTPNVTGVESDSVLAAHARALVPAVKFIEAPLHEGIADAEPFDAIVIDGLVEHIPDAITARLREGGRLAAALLDAGVSRVMRGVKAGGALGLTIVADADAVPLPGFAKPKVFAF